MDYLEEYAQRKFMDMVPGHCLGDPIDWDLAIRRREAEEADEPLTGLEEDPNRFFIGWPATYEDDR